MNVLIIATHPDDETLGVGGTILRHKNNSDELYWLIITNIKDETIWGEKKIQERQKEIKSVASKYSFKNTITLNHETTQLDKIPTAELIKEISDIISDIQPNIIYLNNRSDIHSDHRVSFNAIISATKTFNHPYISKILMYETISETESSAALQENAFVPNCFVDITDYLDKKIDIMKIYSAEIKEHPFPRSEKNIRALATFRGAQCGVEYAEAFMILKDIWK